MGDFPHIPDFLRILIDPAGPATYLGIPLKCRQQEDRWLGGGAKISRNDQERREVLNTKTRVSHRFGNLGDDAKPDTDPFG